VHVFSPPISQGREIRNAEDNTLKCGLDESSGLGTSLPTQRYRGCISVSKNFEHRAEPTVMITERENDGRKMQPKNSKWKFVRARKKFKNGELGKGPNESKSGLLQNRTL
jgi:hypothetical protein